MRYTKRRGLFWMFIFTFLSLLPLGLALIGPTPAFRSFWMEIGVAFGFIALAMFGAQFLFSGRFAWVAPTYGMDNIIHFHREIGIIAFFFVLAHPITLILHDPGFISYFDPRVNLMRAIALIFVTFAVIGIIVTSLWRVSFGLNYEKWRLLHGFLALSIVFIGVVHSVQVSHYLDPLWKKILLAGLMGAFMYLVLHTRIVRPWLNRKYPYRIVDVIEEEGDSFSLLLEPGGFRKMTYKSGQFAWMSVCHTPFTLQQHPFSFASSARSSQISFTAKQSGDFTSSWKDFKPGMMVFLEGPFGSFIPEPDAHLFMIMGGIGVTPAMSMLRTMRDEKDQRQAILIYANTDWEGVTFREELEEIKKVINLKIIHVIEDLPDGVKGEEGRIDEEMLAKYLPENKGEFMYFICGPNALMDVAEIALHNLGVDWRRIYSERFEIV